MWFQVRYNNPVLIDKHPETPSPAPGVGPGSGSEKDGKGKKAKGGGDGKIIYTFYLQWIC